MAFEHLVLVILFLVAVTMAKKKADWRAKAKQAQTDAGGNASFFWSAEIDEWHDITVYPDTVDVRPELDAEGNPHSWKKRTYCEVSTDDTDQMEEEIPFWCIDDFFDELLSSPEDSGEIAMTYKRTKKGGTNRGKFRLSADD